LGGTVRPRGRKKTVSRRKKKARKSEREGRSDLPGGKSRRVGSKKKESFIGGRPNQLGPGVKDSVARLS